MNDRTRIMEAIVAAVLLGFCSCSTAPPWQSAWGSSSGWSNPFRSASAAPSFSGSPGATSAADPLASATQSVNEAFKAAGDKVASAFEVKPKVVPANDPAKLSSQPEHLTPEIYVQAAQLSENQGAIAQAQRQYDKALELAPGDVHTLVAVARFYDRQGQADQALQRYEQARGLAPNNPIVLNDLGLFHVRHGNLDAALQALNQAVRLDSQNVRYRNNLAAALIEAQRVTEAVNVLRGVHPEATALFNTACLLAMKNDTSAAATLLEQSLRVDPTHQAAREMLQALRPETLVARAATPPQGPILMSADPYTPAALETASRPRATVWESTPVDDGAYQDYELQALPRKLPVAY